jgi:hypothetical protein
MSINTTKIETRDAKGQALKVAAIRQALLDSVTPEDMGNIGKALVQRASEGHVGAAKLLFSYIFGKPGSAPELEAESPIASLTVPDPVHDNAKVAAAAAEWERILSSPGPEWNQKLEKLINCDVPVTGFNGKTPPVASKK